MRPLCTFCCGRSHHTLTEDLLWQRLESAHPPQTPDTDPEPSVGAHLPSWVWLSSPVWRPVPPSSPAVVKHCPLHSTPRPHLPSYLHLTSTANSHSQFAFTSNATSPPHPGVTSTSTQTPAHLPHPPHPALTSHNHQTLDRGPQALPSRLSHRLPSQHPINTPPSRAALSSTSQHLSCHAPSRRPQFCAFPMWLPASSFSDATPCRQRGPYSLLIISGGPQRREGDCGDSCCAGVQEMCRDTKDCRQTGWSWRTH